MAPAGSTGIWLLTLVLVWRPLYDTIAYGQVYTVLLLLFALSMKGVLREKGSGTAAPLALALVLKGYGAIPVIFLALRRRWKEIALVLLIAASVIAAALPLVGPSSWQTYLTVVLPSLGSTPPDAHVAYQTVNGFIRHLFTYDPQWFPHPLVPLPEAVIALLGFWGSIAVAGLVPYRSSWRTPAERIRSFAAAIAAGMLTVPLAEEYHFVLFIPLIFVLAAEFEKAGAYESGRGPAIDCTFANVCCRSRELCVKTKGF